MGFLKLFSKSGPTLVRLPSGCFTMDCNGTVVACTITSSFSAATIQEIGRCLLDTFREAQTAQLPISELVLHYGSLKIVARELRGGALVFLTPTNPITPTT